MSDLGRVALRGVTAADAVLLGSLIGEGFSTFRVFQPAEWVPPTAANEAQRTLERLARPGAWGLLALDGADAVGTVLFEPARDLEGVAHLANLFVTRAWWGTGLASDLLGRAVAAMRERGYATARLFTPERQARARAFYEREGWAAVSEPRFEEALQMRLVEYRRALAG